MPWNNQSATSLLIVTAAAPFSGIFVYSPSPGTGNLIASVTGTAGGDPYSNIYRQGITAYDNSGELSQLEATGLLVIDGGGHVVGELQSLTATGAFYLAAGGGGFSKLMTDPLNAVHPGSPPSPAPETWQTLAPVIGFAAGVPAARYKLMPDNTVRLAGIVTLSANQLAGTVFFTLPAGYRPATLATPFGPTNLSGAPANAAWLQIDVTGQMSIRASGTAGNSLIFDGITFPLD